jgi:hypothetical protein
MDAVYSGQISNLVYKLSSPQCIANTNWKYFEDQNGQWGFRANIGLHAVFVISWLGTSAKALKINDKGCKLFVTSDQMQTYSIDILHDAIHQKVFPYDDALDAFEQSLNEL